MTGSWHSLIERWGTWTISGITGFIGGLVGSAFRWRWPSWKEWKEERQEKRDKEIDARVMALLDGKGSSVMVVPQMCERLGLKEDEVRNSLDRLEVRGRVRMGPPTFDSLACWFSLHR